MFLSADTARPRTTVPQCDARLLAPPQVCLSLPQLVRPSGTPQLTTQGRLAGLSLVSGSDWQPDLDGCGRSLSLPLLARPVPTPEQQYQKAIDSEYLGLYTVE